MWVVILWRRNYLDLMAINGRIEMHLETRVLGGVSYVQFALNRDQRWDVVISIFMPSMTNVGNFLPGGFFIAESCCSIQFNLQILPMLAECEQNFRLPEHML
jgi:hypothetical protein